MSNRLLVNIIGEAGSGKSTLTRHWEETFGFTPISPSRAIAAFAAEHGIALTERQDYVTCHRRMHQQTPCAMVAPILHCAAERIVVDGLRVVSHAQDLRELGTLTLALVPAPGMTEREWAEFRLNNIKRGAPARSGRDASDPLTVESLIADEAADKGNTDPDEPNVETVIAMADICIDATQPMPVVHAQADAYIESLLQRP